MLQQGDGFACAPWGVREQGAEWTATRVEFGGWGCQVQQGPRSAIAISKLAYAAQQSMCNSELHVPTRWLYHEGPCGMLGPHKRCRTQLELKGCQPNMRIDQTG